jgi:hypothetical protein
MKISSPIIMTYPPPPRRAFGLLRYLIVAAGIVGVLFYLRHSAQLAAINSTHTPVKVVPDRLPCIPDTQKPTNPQPGTEEHTKIDEPAQVPAGGLSSTIGTPAEKPLPETGIPASKPTSSHPIDELIQKAEKSFADVLEKESHDVNTAAAEYRKRRGRHPPPGFDAWFDFAQKNGAVMVEDFFDQIYTDLAPFWGLNPAILRKESYEYEMVINVRNQKAKAGSDWFWTQIWLNMTRTIEDMLPDIDIPLNAMDEPRILAPWEEVNRLMEIERSTRAMAPAKDVHSSYRTLPIEPEPEMTPRDKNWNSERKERPISSLVFLSANT